MGRARHSQVIRCPNCSSSPSILRLSGTSVRNRRRRLFSYQPELEVCQTLQARFVMAYSKRKLLVRLPCGPEVTTLASWHCFARAFAYVLGARMRLTAGVQLVTPNIKCRTAR